MDRRTHPSIPPAGPSPPLGCPTLFGRKRPHRFGQPSGAAPTGQQFTERMLHQRGRYGDGSGYAFPDHRDIASVLGLVKHKPLMRRPSALLDRPYARWLGIAQVGTAGSVAFRSNRRIAHAAICELAAVLCRAPKSSGLM